MNKHRSLTSELEIWSNSKKAYTENETCTFLVATVKGEPDEASEEKLVGSTALRRADDSVFKKVISDQHLSPNTLAVSISIFAVIAKKNIQFKDVLV